jgi:hypothetical protein
MLRYVCRTRVAEAHLSAMMSAFISKRRHSALSMFTRGVIGVVFVAFKASRATLCRIDAVCDSNSYNTRTILFFHGATAPSGAGPHHYRGFTIIFGSTPLDEWSDRRIDLFLTTHNTRKMQTDIHAHGEIRTHHSQLRSGLRSTL